MHILLKPIRAIALIVVAALYTPSLEGLTIADERVRSLDINPVLGRGYSLFTNSYQSTCLLVEQTTVPSFDFDYSFYEYSFETTTESNGFTGVAIAIAQFDIDIEQGDTFQSESGSVFRHMFSSMRIERYYSSVDEVASALSEDASALLQAEDYIGFFKACGTSFVRGIRRFQDVSAWYKFSSSNANKSRGLIDRVKIGNWVDEDNSIDETNRYTEESSSITISIKGRGLGLTMEGSETLVAESMEEVHRVMKFAYSTMTRNDDAYHIGMIYGIEVIPWVSNTAFHIAAQLDDAIIQLPLPRSQIPKAFRSEDVLDTDFVEGDRLQFQCKDARYVIDKYGYCCDIESLWDYSTGEYDNNRESLSLRVCRPIRNLNNEMMKDNMIANGEFVARLDNTLRYKLNQLGTIEACISAVNAIPPQYEHNLLKGPDLIPFDKVAKMDFSAGQLKMSLDPFNDYAMITHLGKELDEFLEMFMSPCYSALFGSKIGTGADPEAIYFMAYPWYVHDECIRLSCLGLGMRWDRENGEGCVPGLLLGADASSGYSTTQEQGCALSTDNFQGNLECKHASTELANQHEKFVNCWRRTVGSTGVDYLVNTFCMPQITSKKLHQRTQTEMANNRARYCS